MQSDSTTYSSLWRHYLKLSNYVTPHSLLSNPTNKFITFIALVMFEMLIHGLWYIGMVLVSSSESVFGWLAGASYMVNQATILAMGMACFWLICFSVYAIYVIRRLPMKSKAWYGFQLVYIGAYLAYGVFWSASLGQNTAVVGITMLGGMVLGLLFVYEPFVMLAYALCVAAFTFLMLNVKYEWITSLPSFYPFHHADEHQVWSLSYIYLCVSKSLLTVYIVYMVLQLLRDQQLNIRAMSETDPLTTVFNRRNMHYHFHYLWRYPKNWRELSVIYLDIDRFKYINDNYGHEVGDSTLLLVVAAIKEIIDGKFYLCRHGGEEFLIILKDVPLADATAIAEVIRQRISSKVFAYIDPSDQPITASFGVSGIKQTTDIHMGKNFSISYDDFVASIDTNDHHLGKLPEPVLTLLKVVDNAMNDAKRAGRNRVVTVPVLQLDQQFNVLKPSKALTWR